MANTTAHKAALTDVVLDFIDLRKKIFDFFQCDDDYFVKPLLEYNWAIKTEDDFCFLSYWLDEGKKSTAVVVRKNGEPMIYKKDNYTMVVAIDCVKTGFVFSNEKQGN